MPVYLILKRMFPNSRPDIDWEVVDNRITKWDLDVPQPTDEEMKAHWLEVEKTLKRNEFQRLCDAEYTQLLAPEGNLTLVQRDEVLEKRAVNAAGGSRPLSPQEQNASNKIDELRQRRRDRFSAVNQLAQGAGETVEAAVERLRAVSWT